jgi:hypothetical protein
MILSICSHFLQGEQEMFLFSLSYLPKCFSMLVNLKDL